MSWAHEKFVKYVREHAPLAERGSLTRAASKPYDAKYPKLFLTYYSMPDWLDVFSSNAAHDRGLGAPARRIPEPPGQDAVLSHDRRIQACAEEIPRQGQRRPRLDRLLPLRQGPPEGDRQHEILGSRDALLAFLHHHAGPQLRQLDDQADPAARPAVGGQPRHLPQHSRTSSGKEFAAARRRQQADRREGHGQGGERRHLLLGRDLAGQGRAAGAGQAGR